VVKTCWKICTSCSFIERIWTKCDKYWRKEWPTIIGNTARFNADNYECGNRSFESCFVLYNAIQTHRTQRGLYFVLLDKCMVVCLQGVKRNSWVVICAFVFVGAKETFGLEYLAIFSISAVLGPVLIHNPVPESSEDWRQNLR